MLPEAGSRKKGATSATKRQKDPTETERKLSWLHRLQAMRFSTTDSDRLDVHQKLDDERSASRTLAIKQSLEAAAEQHLTVNCCAGVEPFFEHKLTNLQLLLILFAAALSKCHGQPECLTEGCGKPSTDLSGRRTTEIRCSRNDLDHCSHSLFG